MSSLRTKEQNHREARLYIGHGHIYLEYKEDMMALNLPYVSIQVWSEIRRGIL